MGVGGGGDLEGGSRGGEVGGRRWELPCGK